MRIDLDPRTLLAGRTPRAIQLRIVRSVTPTYSPASIWLSHRRRCSFVMDFSGRFGHREDAVRHFHDWPRYGPSVTSLRLPHTSTRPTSREHQRVRGASRPRTRTLAASGPSGRPTLQRDRTASSTGYAVILDAQRRLADVVRPRVPVVLAVESVGRPPRLVASIEIDRRRVLEPLLVKQDRSRDLDRIEQQAVLRTVASVLQPTKRTESRGIANQRAVEDFGVRRCHSGHLPSGTSAARGPASGLGRHAGSASRRRWWSGRRAP